MSPVGTNKDSAWALDLFRHSPDAIIVQDAGGRILTANEALSQLCGVPIAALIGNKLCDFAPPETRGKWEHDLDRLIRGEWTLIEGTLCNAAGKAVPVDLSLVARTDYNGQAAVILHLHNISIFHNVERALLDEQQQWERSFDAIADCMCILDRNGHLHRVNQAMLQRFKCHKDDLIGRDYRTVFGGLKNAPANSAATFNDAVLSAPFLLEPLTFENLEGCFSVSAYQLKGEDAVVTGSILIARDITDQTLTKDALLKSEAALQQAAKMEALGRLAGGIAHDFNNILTSILGYSSLALREMNADDHLCADIREIIRAAERATALTRQLLDFSHDHAVETTAVQLNTVIENMNSLFCRTLGDGIKLVTRLDKDLWHVRADVSRLEQILINLAINARDAMMPKGGNLIIEAANIRLDEKSRSIHPGLRPGNYVLLQVSDTGQGMPPEVLAHIFEPFFTTKPKGTGTGLGLTIIYGIVRQFNGHIYCHSEVNRGTTFKIYLPQLPVAAGTTITRTPSTILARGTESILIVDDEAIVLSIATHILTTLGYKVLTANGACQALTIGNASPDQIDLMLVDVILPEMNGHDLAQAIQKKRPKMKIIYMSGYASEAAMHNGELQHESNFIQKPFSFEALAVVVRRILDNPISPPHDHAPLRDEVSIQ